MAETETLRRSYQECRCFIDPEEECTSDAIKFAHGYRVGEYVKVIGMNNSTTKLIGEGKIELITRHSNRRFDYYTYRVGGTVYAWHSLRKTDDLTQTATAP